MTATRGIIATLVVVTLIGVGIFVWQQSRPGCPEEFGPAQSYRADDEVLFAGKVWQAKTSGSTEVPGPNATDWIPVGTC